MRSLSGRVTRAQWLLAGGLLLIYVVIRLIPHPGTAWESVSGLSFSPDGKKIAVGIYSGYFRHLHERWYFADLKHAVAIVAPTEQQPPQFLSRPQLVQKAGIVNMLPQILIGPSVAFSSDGRLLAAVGFDGAFNIWDVDNGQLVRQQSMEQPQIRAFVKIPGRNSFITTFRRWASTWNFAGGPPSASLETTVNIQAVVPAPDGKQFALAGFKPMEIQFWDTNKDRLLSTYQSPIDAREGITSMGYTPDGKTLVAANDENIELIDVPTRTQTACIPERMVLALAVSPDGRQLATARFDGVTLWDLPKRQKTSLHWKGPPTETVQFSPDGRLLAAGSADGFVRVWRVDTGELVGSWNFPGPSTSLIPQYFKITLVLAWTVGFLIYARQFVDRHWPWLRNFRF